MGKKLIGQFVNLLIGEEVLQKCNKIISLIIVYIRYNIYG